MNVTKSIVVFFAALVSLGCAGSTKYQSAKLPEGSNITILKNGDYYSYVIDPMSESCFLKSTTGMAPTDCGALARNLPEARKVITWSRAATVSE